MTIEVPEDELTGMATALRTGVVTAASTAERDADAADDDTDGILHQGAASKVEAVAQKLASAAELGGSATTGLAQGLDDVVTAFGVTDESYAGG